MSHGAIAMFDSFLRKAWYSDERFPLSAALHASANMKRLCNGLIHVGNPRSINFSRPNKPLTRKALLIGEMK